MNGRMSPLLAQIRFRAVAPFVRGRVLDYGSGEGMIQSFVAISDYTGVDASQEVIHRAQKRFPQSRFLTPQEFMKLEETFDTITVIATFGLIKEQLRFLQKNRSLLNKEGCLVITSPDPRLNGLHRIGGWLGLFSSNMGYERSEQLPDKGSMVELAGRADLELVTFRRFMLGCNQLFVFKRR